MSEPWRTFGGSVTGEQSVCNWSRCTAAPFRPVEFRQPDCAQCVWSNSRRCKCPPGPRLRRFRAPEILRSDPTATPRRHRPCSKSRYFCSRSRATAPNSRCSLVWVVSETQPTRTLPAVQRAGPLPHGCNQPPQQDHQPTNPARVLDRDFPALSQAASSC